MRSSVRTVGVFAVLLLARSIQAEQPIAYSHKQHIALGLHCLDCHINADRGAAATIPSAAKCMLCHAKIATDKTEIKKVAAYFSSKREIPWERVYGFAPEALVHFQHGPHIRAKVLCDTCHGDMTQATTAKLAVNHTMGRCLTCHRQNKVSEDCNTCHY